MSISFNIHHIDGDVYNNDFDNLLIVQVDNNPKSQFSVWTTQGEGGYTCAWTYSLQEALDFVKEHKTEASFGIKDPDGTWHKWD